MVAMVAPLFFLAARSWIYGINFALLSVLGNNILFLPCSEILFTDICSPVASMKYRLAMCGLNTLYQILNFGNFMRSGVLERVDNVKRGRGRPKLTWDESVKRDLKDWNISKEIALDRSAWRLAINVPEP